MMELKDNGSELRISKPRVAALVIAVIVSPIYLVLDVYHHETLGEIGSLSAYALLALAYVQRDRLNGWRQHLKRKSPAD